MHWIKTILGELYGLFVDDGAFALAIVVWLAVAFLFRYSSLSALTACIVVPIALYLLGHPEYALAFVVMSVLVFYKHRANISRLLAGTEGKIGAKG